MAVVYRLCQCSLFKQFTTELVGVDEERGLFIDYVNVLFSSNSQPQAPREARRKGCLSIMSMFSFQAIHNTPVPSNSPTKVVYRLCQCSLFKQFTTPTALASLMMKLFIDYVNVLFSSNSQLYGGRADRPHRCLSIMSMFSFQAIHNDNLASILNCNVVYRLCQCSLFKQFTTLLQIPLKRQMLFIDYVNVLFSSNSQPLTAVVLAERVVYRLCQCSLFKQFTTG